MNLTIDIGNTRTKLGLFDKKGIKAKVVWEKLNVTNLRPFCQKNKVERVALSTVGAAPLAAERYLKANFYYLQLNHKTPLPITNLYKTPKTLGKDRIAAIIGAYSRFPGKNCLVIDAGTCITYDFLDADAKYHGGGISPGIAMRLKAMHHFTAKLPLVSQKKEPMFIGNTTKTALQSGGQLGAVMELEGFIRQYRARFGKINVLLTGGDTIFFANNLKTKIFADSNLVLCGLNKILNYNVRQQE